MLKTKIKDIEFNSPILVASGTFGFGDELSDMLDINELGGIVTKSITLKPREGNPPPRIAETHAGMLNSIGLANVGVEVFCKEKLPFLNRLKTKVIINIAGSTFDEYIRTIEKIEDIGGNHIGYEINISCPNVKEGGMEFGINSKVTEKLTLELRKITDRLLIMKLSPNVTRIEDIALSAENGGADAISAINTLDGMSIDIQSRKPTLFTGRGGLSGPAIKPVAIALVNRICRVLSIPVIGIGGISSYEDIIEFILAGVNMVQIGTLNFREPGIGLRLNKELKNYCIENNIPKLQELKGKVELYS